MTDTPNRGAESVEVSRRRLRATARQYRIDVHLTQKEAADELGWSVSKLLRLEQGSSPITPSDVRALLHVYRETDIARVDAVVELAKQARDNKGYSAFSDVASAAYQELMGLEVAAKVIYKYEASVIPGLFQTEEYTRALSKALGFAPGVTDRHVELRMLRQRQMFESASRPELNFLLGEAALARRVGSVSIMNEQFNRLLELSGEDGLNISLLPFESGPHRRMGSAFTVIQLGDDQLSDVLYLEGPDGESVSRDEEGDIKFYLELYVELLEKASSFGAFEEQLEAIRHTRHRRQENSVA
jgi:transcriptional regulator with XRE-family HTH domain